VREWSAAAFLGYISTWSAARRAREAGKGALLTAFFQDLLALWGDPQPSHHRWPIAMRLGSIE
jgi:hypothetical protein